MKPLNTADDSGKPTELASLDKGRTKLATKFVSGLACHKKI